MLLLYNFILVLLMATTISGSPLYDYTVTNIAGKEVSMNNYKGNVIMIVNTASECGFTPQYAELQELYEEYKDKGLVVLGFPSNNFGNQEPGTDKDIKEFCDINFNITFPLFSKTAVKGEEQHPLFSYLTNLENENFKGEIGWNFEKFLISRDGNLKYRFKSEESPKSEDVLKAVRQLL